MVLGAGVHVEVNQEPVFCFLPEGVVLPPEQAVIAMRNGLIYASPEKSKKTVKEKPSTAGMPGMTGTSKLCQENRHGPAP